MQHITVEGIEFVVYMSNKMLHADAVNELFSFAYDLSEISDDSDPLSWSIAKGSTLKFIKGYSKLALEYENTTVVLEHVLVVEYKTVRSKLLKLLSEENDLGKALKSMFMLNKTLEDMRENAYGAAYEQANFIDIHIKKLNGTLHDQDADQDASQELDQEANDEPVHTNSN